MLDGRVEVQADVSVSPVFLSWIFQFGKRAEIKEPDRSYWADKRVSCYPFTIPSVTAIPVLLDLLDIKGSIVTIDAMGTQKDVAEKIIEQSERDMDG